MRDAWQKRIVLALALVTLGSGFAAGVAIRPRLGADAAARLAGEDFPAPVREVLDLLTLGQEIRRPVFERGVRNGKAVFKAGFLLDGVAHKYNLDEDGKVLDSRWDVALGELPAAVTAGIQRALPGAVLLAAERQQEDDVAPFFAVDVRHGGREQALLIADDGRILRPRTR